MNRILKGIYERRSVRKYRSSPVDSGLIEQLLDAGRMAPSGMNQQPWHFHVVRDATLIDEMEHAIMDVTKKIHRLPGAPSFLQEENAIFHGAPVVIFISASKTNEWAGLDVGMCAQNIMLAANALGLDSCPVGLGKLIEKTELYSFLNIPKQDSILISLVVGYGAEKPVRHERKKDNVTYVNATTPVQV